MKRRASTHPACIPSLCGESNRLVSCGETAESPDEGDALLVKELTNLTIAERQRVLEEVHGVADVQEETEEFVEESLQQLEKELAKIRKKPAYDKAVFMSPNFVQDREFRLMFLRADSFDTRLAAQRLVKHFARKIELFGMDQLVRQITLHDLDEDDMTTLEAGATQIVPVKDQMGRTVMTTYWKHMKTKSYINQIKSWWYLMMTLLVGDQDTQRKGIVEILYQVEHRHFSSQDKKMMTEASQYVEAVPFKFAAHHYCYDNAMLRPALSLVQLAIGTQGRLRFRAHYGSHLECRYALSSFGIPADPFPVGIGGELRVDQHLRFLEKRKNLEMMAAVESESRGTIEFPLSRDVVLGRGKPYHLFPGNIQLATIIDQRKRVYHSSDRLEKTAMSNNIVGIVKAWHGRFLKRDETSSGWVEVEDEQAREKVSHAFRTNVKKVLAVERQSVPDESWSHTSAVEGGSAELVNDDYVPKKRPKSREEAKL